MADGQTGGTFGGSGWTRRRALRGLAALGTVGVPAVSGGARATGSAGVRNVGQESPDGWAQGAKLVADDAESGDSFGTSVAVSGSTTVVGADGDENGDGLAAGAAYAFEDDDGWRQSAKLLPDRKRGEDQYGRSVAVSGSTAVVGAYDDDTRNGDSAGSVYVFEARPDWQEVDRVVAAAGTSDQGFAAAVDVSGSTAVAGAFGDGGPGGEFRGAAYTFAGPGDDRSVGSSGDDSTPDRQGGAATTGSSGGSPSLDRDTGADDDTLLGGREWPFPTEWVVAALGGATVGAYWLGTRRRDDRREE